MTDGTGRIGGVSIPEIRECRRCGIVVPMHEMVAGAFKELNDASIRLTDT
jgi:hypothetical protein